MGRRPCCLKEGVNRGAWSAQEDQILSEYIKSHGEGKWRDMPKRAGLRRCGKSCRLRWLNYLRPDIKRGNIAPEEEDLIIRLHKLLGNRWSLIAGRLPGRTDNEIKNYWNTCLSKRMKAQSSSKTTTDQEHTAIKSKESRPSTNTAEPGEQRLTTGIEPHQVIRTKAGRCTKLLFSPPKEAELITQNDTELEHNEIPPFLAQHKDDCLSFLMDFDMGEIDILDSNYMMQVAVGDHEIHEKISNPMGGDNDHLSEAVFDDWKESFSVANGACLELEMQGLF